MWYMHLHRNDVLKVFIKQENLVTMLYTVPSVMMKCDAEMMITCAGTAVLCMVM